MTTYKKPHVYLDPKTGLLVRKTRLVPKRGEGKRSRVPSRLLKAASDLFGLKWRKK